MTTATPARLTDQQVRDTVAAMNTTDALKAALLRQALNGDPGARFSVYGAYRRQQGTR